MTFYYRSYNAPRALYCEIEPFAVDWLRNLIGRKFIADGDVAPCSIEDLTPSDVSRYVQFHGFAGIGLWSLALRQAGWTDDRPVWTISCPCQPFSAAGKGGGFADERHLWPATFHLVETVRPSVILGEQVASPDGLTWVDLVQDDMEGTGYTFAALDTSSAVGGAPHIRQRLRFVGMGNAISTGLEGHSRRHSSTFGYGRQSLRSVTASGELGRMADADGRQCDGVASGEGRQPDGTPTGRQQGDGQLEHDRELGGMADAAGRRVGNERQQCGGQFGSQSEDNGDVRFGNSGSQSIITDAMERPNPLNGFWRDADWLYCRDGKWRPVESGTFPLAHGLPRGVGDVRARVEGLDDMAGSLRRAKAYRTGSIKAYGNAIDVTATELFIRAVMNC